MQGFRHRRRRVLWEPADLPSKACPHLLESAQCEEPSCYLWRVRPLEDCVPGESACGPGTARQNVTCVDTEGTRLEASCRYAALTDMFLVPSVVLPVFPLALNPVFDQMVALCECPALSERQ